MRDHVTIVMAVYNGAPNLREQLASFRHQSHLNWSLVASDDGSVDCSGDILTEFRDGNPDKRITLLDGPRRGFAQNFLSVLRRMPRSGGWIAFSDQDDVWLPDRLSRGMAALHPGDDGQPALYCSRTWITDASLRKLRLSLPRMRPVGFRNALTQNIAAGNTILLNPAASALMCSAAQEVGDVVAHDWWCYQLITGVGGRVVYDSDPTLLYRQHDHNEIGVNDGLAARVRRISMILSGQYRQWNEINIAALRASYDRLAPENQNCLEAFDKMRQSWPPRALWDMWRIGLYRQSTASTCALGLAALFGRI